jgi:tetratricopeptide (TPR) repeat protein
MGAPVVVSLTAEIPEEHRDLLYRVPRAAASFIAGAGQLVVPVGFSPEYAAEPPGPWAAAVGATAFATIAIGALFAWRLRARAAWLALGALIAVVGYLPNLGFVPLTNLRADRYFYLPSLGLCLAAAAVLVEGLGRMGRRHPGGRFEVPAMWGAVLCLILVLGVRTVRVGRFWSNDRALWRHATETEPNARRAWLALAEVELRAGRTVEALRAVDRGLALAEDAHGLELRGLVLLRQGDLGGARAELERVLAAAAVEGQHRAQVLNNLGVVELKLGQARSALARFREAMTRAPRYSQAAINTARAARELGMVAEAEATLRDFLSRVPEAGEAWRELGSLLEAEGRHGEAQEAYARAGDRGPDGGSGD